MNNLDFHNPVLLKEMIERLAPKDGEVYLDATFGAGGYSRAILEAANCHLYAIDRDDTTQQFADALKKDFPGRFTLLKGAFSDSVRLLAEANVTEIDGMVLDIGVSSMQLDDKERGFSFDSDAKLDMRMDRKIPISAFEVVNELTGAELTKIIKEYGDEPKAKKIARKIVETRQTQPITSCGDLADIVRSLYYGYSKTDPATKTFQALRIHVNEELEELKLALDASITLVKKGGRLVVVSFHSLEDRIVKNFLKKEAGLDKTISRYQPENHADETIKNYQLITKSAISPTREEVVSNVRCRSSKMRVGLRI